MSWYPTTHALVSLAGTSVPAAVGLLAWRRRDKTGAAALAVLLWLLALWGFVNAVELGARSGDTVGTLYKVRGAILLSTAPLWLAFVLRYTWRERWLT